MLPICLGMEQKTVSEVSCGRRVSSCAGITAAFTHPPRARALRDSSITTTFPPPTPAFCSGISSEMYPEATLAVSNAPSFTALSHTWKLLIMYSHSLSATERLHWSSCVSPGAASAALLTVQLPSAFLQFVFRALRTLGVSSQIANHSPERFEPVQPGALGGRLKPDL
ncbi:hypothetical protein EYF80_021776 [Liparis tanakae]|uniref:Uncharacterized protein n=1 Tax=Liparis tanakae TaxID=230148 RepID=A0A4Z2HSK0_9TELE|nr:hypothetical protein EYF80_021776 [Liparis tanakae]